MALETIGLKAVIEGVSSYLNNLDKIEKAEKQAGDAAEKAEKKTQAMGKALTVMSTIGTTAFVGLGALALKFATGFENQMSQVGAILQANDDDMKQLSATAKQLGADTAFSANDAAKAMEELAAGGRSVAQIVGGEASAAVSLAAAGNYDLANSARTIATTMDVWKGTQIDTNDVVNRLAGAANASRFGVEDMSQAIASGGGVAAQAGVSFQDFSTVIAATASSFNSGSDAGTSFKTFITSLTGNSDKAKEMIKELGLEFYNAQGQLKPMSEIVQQLNEKLSGLSQEQQTVALKTIFGNDAFRTAAGLMKMTGDEFTAMSQKMGNTNASDVAKQRMDNLSGSLEQLKGSLETIAIATGERVIPMMTTLAQGATGVVNAFGALPGSTQSMVLGFSAIVVALPAVISGIEKAAKFAMNLGDAMSTFKGKAGLFVAGIGAATLALDLLLQKTTGAGLVDRVFGDVAKIEASKDAVRKWDAALQAAGPTVDKNKLAMQEMERVLEAAGGKSADLTEKVDGLNNVLLGSDGRFFGVATSASKAVDKTKDFEAQVETLGAAMKANGVDVQTLKNIYDTLPASLQDNFDKVTNVKLAYEAYSYTLSQNADELDLLAVKQTIAAGATDSQGQAAERAMTPLDLFKESLAEMEEQTGEAADEAKEFGKQLDALAGRFSAFNPKVTEAQGELAAVDEELADLERSGGNWSETLQMTGEQLKARKKDLEDFIGAADENEKAIKGMRDELQLYTGQGLLNLESRLASSNLALEDQISAEEGVAKALRALNNDDIPGFISALGEVEKKVPGISQTVVDNLGPDLQLKLKGNIPELRATGSALGDAIATGLEQGLGSAANRIVNAARGLAKGATDAMAEAVESNSPSKVTIRLGKDIAAGLSIGIEDGAVETKQRAAMAVNNVMHTIVDTIDSGEQMTGQELTFLFDGLSDIIQQNQLAGDVQSALYSVMQGFVKGIEDGSGVANTALLGFLDDLKKTIENNPLPGPKMGAPTGGGSSSGGGSFGGGGTPNVPSYILGTDGKWYPNEASMPPGVTGASSIPYKQSPYGDAPSKPGSSYGETVQNAKNGVTWIWNGKEWIMRVYPSTVRTLEDGTQITDFPEQQFPSYAKGLSYVPRDMAAIVHRGERIQRADENPYGTLPAVASVAVASRPGGNADNRQYNFDFTGATLTGTIAENESMMRRVVREELDYQAGHGAHVNGVD